MSRRELLVQGCSPESTCELVQMFVENLLPSDVDVDGASMEDGAAMLTLSRDMSEKELCELREKLSSKPLQGCHLRLGQITPAILVSDLPDDVNQELLELYFEYEKYGGGEVEEVALYPAHHSAVITFTKPATIASVLSYGCHKISQQVIKVERCSSLWKPKPVEEIEPVYETIHAGYKETETMDYMDTEENPYMSLTPGSLFPPTRDPVSLPEAGDRVGKPYASVAPTVSMPRAPTTPPVLPPAPEKPPSPEPVAPVSYQEHWEGSATKYEAVKELIHDRCKALEVKITRDSQGSKTNLFLEGPQAAVTEAKMFILEQVMNVEERKLKLNQVTAGILQTKPGQLEAKKMLKGMTVELVEVSGLLSVVGQGDDHTRAARAIEGMFNTAHIKLEEHNREFMKTEPWKVALREVQSDDGVRVTQKHASIDFEGLSSHVKEARTTLLETLKKNSFKKEMIPVKKGVYRFIKQHMADDVEEIRTKHSISLRVVEQDRKWFVQYQGCAENVTAATASVQKLAKSVAYGTDMCGKPGMATFFTKEKSNGHRLVKSLETSHECTIEIRGEDGGARSLYASLPRPDSWRTESLPVGGGGARGRGRVRRDCSPIGLAEAMSRTMSRPARVECAVQLQKGDIVRWKADMVVNSVANANADLSKCGMVAAAFAKQAGVEMSREFASIGGLKCGQVRATMASGNLNTCKYLLHASIRNWDGDRTYKLLCDVVKDCLEQARTYDCRSIAFPTLGCGRLKYPVREVARCFRDTTARHGKGLQVTLVAYEDEVYRALGAHLQQGAGPLPTATPFRQRDAPADKAPPPRRTYKRQDHHTPQGVTFHINARSENGIAAVKSELQAIVKDNYSEAEEHNACLEFAEDADVAKILSHRSDTVIIDPDLDNKMVKFRGEKNSVNMAREKVRGIIKEMKKKQEDPEYVRKYHGKKKFLQAMLNDKAKEKVPPHWTKNTGTFSKLLAKFLPSQGNVLVDVDERTRAAIDKLVTKTWKTGMAGLGADAVGLSHSMIQVKKVQRIENPKVYRSYRTQLSLACEEALKCDFPPVTQLDDKSEILTASLAIPELESIRMRELNEYFLFHGTKNELVENIVVQGPETRFSSTGLFGSGLYLSESSTKADQYADDKKQRRGTGTPLYMVVFRVILGHIHHQRGSATYKRPPCRQSGCHSDKCPHPQHFDSVMGTDKDGGVRLNFREFVLFENNRAYPEFLVTYVRL